MSNDDLLVSRQTTLYPACLPIPEHDVTGAISAANPFPVRREANLTGVTGDRMPREALLPVLTEVVGAVDEDLVIERLRGKISFWSES